jgi:hypothetical protein
MATYIVNKTLTDFTERLVCTWSFQVFEYYDGGDYGYHAECKDPNCDLKQVISSIVTGEGVKYTRDDVVVIKNGKEQIACQELKSRVEKLLVSKIKGEFYFSINLNTYTNTIKIEFQLEKKAPDRNISRYSQGEIISWTVKIIGGILIAVFIAIVIVTQTNDTTHYSEGWALLGGTACLFIGFFLCCFDFDLQ